MRNSMVQIKFRWLQSQMLIFSKFMGQIRHVCPYMGIRFSTTTQPFFGQFRRNFVWNIRRISVITYRLAGQKIDLTTTNAPVGSFDAKFTNFDMLGH